MTRVLSLLGIGGVLGLGLVLGLLWADSPVVPSTQLERQRSFPASMASTTRDTFTVMTYNLNYLSRGASAKGPSARLDPALRLIRQVDPDVLGLQEVNLGRSRFDPAHPLDSIAARMDYTAAVEAVRRNDRFVPFPLSNPGPSVAGQAVLSRYPLRRHVRREIDSTGMHRNVLGLFDSTPVVQVTAVGIGGWPLIVMNVNIDAPDVATREQQARAVNRLYQRVASQGFPALLIGSVHSPMPSTILGASSNDDTMELLVGNTDLKPALSPESARVTGRSVATYPSDDPSRTIDYIFYRPQLVVPIEAKTWCDGPHPSVHCPVSLSFFLPRPLDRLSKGPIPDETVPSLDRLLDGAGG